MDHLQVDDTVQQAFTGTSVRNTPTMNANQADTSDDLLEKRKSIVFMAAEAVQQERDTIRALKRLSMGGGGSLALDPELSFGIEHELESVSDINNATAEDEMFSSTTKKRSSSGSSLISETSFDDDYEESDLTLVENDKVINNQDNQGIQIDAEKLLWVPAKSHPSIAPDQFKRHVQNTLDDMNKKITASSSVLSSSSKRNYSLPSLKELTDELDKLTEMAGLEANDAITLARSLSSASSSSHLLLSKENLLFDDKIRRSSSNDSNSEANISNESDIDEDSPLFTSTNSLKRNKWNTYSRRRRVNNNKDKSTRLNSPLTESSKKFNDNDENNDDIVDTPPEPLSKDVKILPANSLNSKPLPEIMNQSRPSSLQDQLLKQQQRQQGHRSPSLPEQKHFYQSSSEQQSFNDESPLNRSHSDKSHSSIQNPFQSAARTNHSRNRHAGSMISFESNSNASPSSSNSYTPNPYHRKNSTSKKYEEQILISAPEVISKDSSEVPISSTTSPTSPTEDYLNSPSSSPPTSQTTSPQKPSSKKESKSKEFLNLFKMKRSISPKVKKSSGGVINDENLPFIDTEMVNKDSQFQDFQQQFQQQQQQQQQKPSQSVAVPTSSANQRPNISNGSSFNFSKQTKILQESVKNLPSKNLRKISNKNQISNGDIYANTTKYETSPTSPTFDQTQLQFPSQQQQLPQQQQQQKPSNLSKKQTSPSKQPIQQTSTPQLDANQPSPPISTQQQKEQLKKKLSMDSLASSSTPGQQRPNAPLKFTDSPFGFPLPPLSHSTIIMLDYRFPIHVERAIYRLSHLKLANAKRPLRQQVLLSNFMYAYLNLVNHTLYLQQLEEGGEEQEIVEHPIAGE